MTLCAGLTLSGCGDDAPSSSGGTEETGDGDGDQTGDGDGDPTGDGDGDPTGDGDGDPTGDGDGDPTGDGDGDPTGDGDGDPTGDGDGDPTGDGDGDPTGDGDGDPTGDGDGDGDLCGNNVLDGDEVCDDGVNDNSYDGCAADCLSFGPNCGDNQVTDAETCDDGVNDGSYGSCANDCLTFAAFCGDGQVNGPEDCDDDNDDLADGCMDNCAIPSSCLDILTYDANATDGVYKVAPDGYNDAAFDVYCDMTTDGGGYTFLKRNPGAQTFAVAAETDCATFGMQLWIPRSEAHKDSGWAISNDANIGPDASGNYMRILGIYPDVQGATCANQPLNSDNANCGWSASDDLAFYVHAANNFGEPNGDNSTTGSMYYQWNMNGDVVGFNDIPGNGYSSDRYMCDVGDKLP